MFYLRLLHLHYENGWRSAAFRIPFVLAKDLPRLRHCLVEGFGSHIDAVLDALSSRQVTLHDRTAMNADRITFAIYSANYLPVKTS